MSFGRLSTPLLPIIALPLVLMCAAPASAGPSNRHYVGAGVRIGDGTGLAINAKFQVKELSDRWSLSLRPTLILDNATEMRAAFTAEAAFGRMSPYFGGGLAYNVDGKGQVDPMLSGGMDVSLHRNFVVRVGGNYIFQDGETEAEMLITGNYAF